MPPKTKKKRNRRFNKKKITGRPPSRALGAPRPYFFKRTFSNVQTITPGNSYWTSSGNNLGKAWSFNLQSIGSESEFQGLFKYYKLSGARLRMYFSNTGSPVVTDGHTGNYFPNAQIMVTIDRNMDGDASGVADENLYLQSQTAKRRLALRNDGKPLDIYMPLKQLANVTAVDSSGAISAKTVLTRPKWTSTQDSPTVAHTGYNMLLQRVDGLPFTDAFTNSQTVRIMTTLYFQCKKVE